MTDQGNPGQRLLDLLVYAPAGLMLTAVEELPQLADKGRRRIEGQVTTARVVGQFTVQFVRREVRQRLAGTGSSGFGFRAAAPEERRSSSVPVSRPVSPEPTTGPDRSGGVVSRRRPSAAAAPDRDPRQSPASAAGGSPTQRTPLVRVPDVAVTDGGSTDLAIPGYDSLSASQVVQRLPGLTTDDLHRVLAHESSNRHRRTIINRAEQLLGGTAGSGDG